MLLTNMNEYNLNDGMCGVHVRADEQSRHSDAAVVGNIWERLWAGRQSSWPNTLDITRIRLVAADGQGSGHAQGRVRLRCRQLLRNVPATSALLLEHSRCVTHSHSNSTPDMPKCPPPDMATSLSEKWFTGPLASMYVSWPARPDQGKYAC